MFRSFVICVCLLGGAVSATAQTAQDSKPAAKAKDSNRKICEEFKETGSRLAGRRVCMTAADWAAQRQDNRNDTEHAQKSIYLSGNN